MLQIRALQCGAFRQRPQARGASLSRRSHPRAKGVPRRAHRVRVARRVRKLRLPLHRDALRPGQIRDRNDPRGRRSALPSPHHHLDVAGFRRICGVFRRHPLRFGAGCGGYVLRLHGARAHQGLLFRSLRRRGRGRNGQAVLHGGLPLRLRPGYLHRTLRGSPRESDRQAG